MRIGNLLFGTYLFLTVVSPTPILAQQSCENLIAVQLDHASVVSARTVEAGPMKLPPNPLTPRTSVEVPRHCEVKGVARPTSDSEINFELWMPDSGSWNGKYMQRGNGGWAGSIPVTDLIGSLTRGYAVAATDDGHTGGQMPDAAWAIGHPEKLIDFGYRAVHETAIHSKVLLHAFYGTNHTQAYFVGCSDGGREALMEAQRYPEDFNGIVAGAPANNWTRHFTGFVWNEKALHDNPAGTLPVTKLPVIQKAALAACDALDGVKDSLIEDPRECKFDPSVLKCAGEDRADCLTAPQIETLKKIYSGPVNPKTGEQIYPGYEPGTEADATGWGIWILGPVQAMFGNSFFGQAVYEDPKWDWNTIDYDRDLKLADQKTGPILNSYNPDLRSYRANGGKLIQYHGWGDAAIAPRDSIAYYEKVRAFMTQYPDPRNKGSNAVDDFYRLFMVPGMGHCSGGPGPVNFGNMDLNDNQVPQDAEHDIVTALDKWVTQGVAPERLIGAGKTGGILRDPSEGTKLTRPLCWYPQVAKYKGSGSTVDAANFVCKAP